MNRSGKEIPMHPLVFLWPPMRDEDFQALCADIAERGLEDPVTLVKTDDGDMIVEGRHRARACWKTGAELRTTYYTGDDLFGYVNSKNSRRREQTASQKACSAVLAVENPEFGFRERAKARQGTSVHKCTEVGGAVSEAARTFGVSRRSVYNALKVYREDSDLFQRCFEGTLTVGAALTELDKRELKAHPALELIPDMTPREFEGLKHSIRVTGLLMPITLLKTEKGELIVDGRQRYRACLEVGVTPTFQYLDEATSFEDIVAFIRSANLIRQSLTEEQQAASVLHLIERAAGDAELVAEIESQFPYLTDRLTREALDKNLNQECG